LDDALNKMVKFMDDHPEAGALGPKILNPDGSLQPSYAKFPNLTSAFFGFGRVGKLKDKLSILETDWLGGACLMVRAKVIEQVGMLDERFYFYSEDTDWCYRIKKNGWKIAYLPDAQVTHHLGASSKFMLYSEIQLWKSQYRFYKKHHSWISSFIFKFLMRLKCVLKICKSRIAPPTEIKNKERTEASKKLFRDTFKWK